MWEIPPTFGTQRHSQPTNILGAMPTSNEEPLLPAGEAVPAPVSPPVHSVSEVNEQLETVKLADQDEASPAEAETKPKEHPDLWKPPPPSEECPVCLVPLPLEREKTMYWVCCGKLICYACCEEHNRALSVTNRKRDKKKLSPLGLTCPFCRSPIHRNDSELMSHLEKRIEKEDTVAMLNLGMCFRDGSDGVKKDEAKASELFNRAADLGSSAAIGQLGCWAINGQCTSPPNVTKGREYVEDAAAKGHILSRATLASMLLDEGNIDLAMKHWHLAAAAGCDNSMKNLWDCFSKGKLSKPDLEKALRAHKAALDEMNSEERERFATWRDAEAVNDELLKAIYNMYYLGHINAKELQVALKAHQSKDWGKVGTQLKIKIQLYFHA